MCRFTLATLLIVLAAACTPAGDGVEEVRIGLVLQQDMIDGPSTVRAVRLAVDEVNAAGGLEVGGRRVPVELIVSDHSLDLGDVARSALRLINRERVVALIGPNLSHSAIPISRAANDARVPMVTPTATHPAVTAGKPFVFRVSYTDDFQGRAIARVAHDDLGAPTAAVLYDAANTYSVDLGEVFRQAFTDAGGTVVAFESYLPSQDEPREQLARIREARPRVLFLPNFTAAVARLAEPIRRQGIDATLLGGDSWAPSALAEVPELDGSYVVAAWHRSAAASNPRAEAFLDAYRQAWGEAPPYATPLFAYDAVGLVFAALRRAGKVDPEALRQELAETVDYPGTSGTITFRGTDGDPESRGIVLELGGGEVRYVRSLAPPS